MAKIAIVTDVNAGLDYLGYDPQIPTLRSIINFKDEHYIDGIEIKADEFYERLSKEDVIPSTSAPTVGEAMELIERLISEGYTDMIMYSISYQLSSIGQMVENLKSEYSDKINIYVVDTKLATYMQGYLAIVAKKMVEEGKSVKEILDYSDYLIKHQHAYFIVDNLSYLVKKEGKIVSKEKVKTHRRAIERTLELFLNEIGDNKNVQIFVFHTLREKEALEIKEYLASKVDTPLEIQVHMVTPAVGAHIGCGILGFGYFILGE